MPFQGNAFAYKKRCKLQSKIQSKTRPEERAVPYFQFLIALMELGRKYHSDTVHKSRDQGIKVSESHIDSLAFPETQTRIKNALSEWTLKMLASEDLIYMNAEPVDNGG
ncbi:hypothetical protein BC830DRAFT_1080551 [Chytriomyces sp. MP71]|nr:hypothetical protein BC830DRAFT_1080551 [Chytriomyces sp. MP71]